MLLYIFKRILIFVPTLIVITLLGFIISVNAPGDPVERMMVANQTAGADYGIDSKNHENQKILWRKKLGLDLPIFYCSLTSVSRPDTLYKIYNKQEREAIDRLIDEYGNWEQIQNYFQALHQFNNELQYAKLDSNDVKKFENKIVLETINQLKNESSSLLSSHESVVIEAKLKNVSNLLSSYKFLSPYQDAFEKIKNKYSEVQSTISKWKNYLPKIVMYGFSNQYHRWLLGDGGTFSKGLLRGDLGTSYITKQPISEIIYSKIGWSLFFTILSVVLAYLISIPIGVRAASKFNSSFDKTTSIVLFVLYSVPSFWLATLLLMTFANTDVLGWLPASGVKPATGYPEGASFIQMVKISFPYIILPAICYTYSSFAFLSRTMRTSMLETVSQDYIRTARAKGLSERKVIWKHGFKNALLPIVTVFANVFPAAIGGSVIIETIFTIPGMGFEIIYAIQNNNYPMIIAVLTITGFLTLLGYLIADILYAIIDPRISYK